MKTQRDLFPSGRNKWGYRLWRILLGARGLFGVIFFGLAAPAFASATLDALVNAAARFSAAIGQQLVMLKNDPAPAEFAEKTVAYAESKTAYFTALREEMPELNNIATRRKLQLLQLDDFIVAFSLANEKQHKVADEQTRVLLKRFSGDPDVDKAGVEFERAQKIEESFHEDFDGIDFTSAPVIMAATQQNKRIEVAHIQKASILLASYPLHPCPSLEAGAASDQLHGRIWTLSAEAVYAVLGWLLA